MPYYALMLPNGVRFSMLPPSTDYSQAECDVYRYARRGKASGTLHSSGLKPMNDKDRATEYNRGRNRKAKEAKESCQ